MSYFENEKTYELDKRKYPLDGQKLVDIVAIVTKIRIIHEPDWARILANAQKYLRSNLSDNDFNVTVFLIISDAKENYRKPLNGINSPKIPDKILMKIILKTVIEALQHEGLQEEWRKEKAALLIYRLQSQQRGRETLLIKEPWRICFENPNSTAEKPEIKAPNASRTDRSQANFPSVEIKKLSERVDHCLSEMHLEIGKLRAIRSAECGNKVFALNYVLDELKFGLANHKKATEEFEQPKIDEFQKWVVFVEKRTEKIKEEVLELQEKSKRPVAMESSFSSDDELLVTPPIVVDARVMDTPVVSTPVVDRPESTASFSPLKHRLFKALQDTASSHSPGRNGVSEASPDRSRSSASPNDRRSTDLPDQSLAVVLTY